MGTGDEIDEAEAIWRRVYTETHKLARARRDLATAKRCAKAAAKTMRAAASFIETAAEGANDPGLDVLVRKLRRQADTLDGGQ